MTAVLIIVLVIITPFVIRIITKGKEKTKLVEVGYNPTKNIRFSNFVGGHPDIDKLIGEGYIISDGEILAICDLNFKKMGRIPKNTIKAVDVEDATSIQKRLLAGKLILMGAFANAWQRKKKKAQSYVIIEWNDGSYTQYTTFEFEYFDSLHNANNFKDSIVHWIKPN